MFRFRANRTAGASLPRNPIAKQHDYSVTQKFHNKILHCISHLNTPSSKMHSARKTRRRSSYPKFGPRRRFDGSEQPIIAVVVTEAAMAVSPYLL
jgi:hypothetical protein